MATQVMTDAKIYVGGYNVSGVANEAVLQMTPQILNSTVFGLGGTSRYQPGLLDFKIEAKGFNDYAVNLPPLGTPNVSLDQISFQEVTLLDEFAIAPLGNTELDLAFIAQGVTSSYSPVSATIGALAPWSLNGMASGVPVVRGFVQALGLKTATGQTAAPLNVIAGVTAGQKLYASLHVISATGTTPTLNVIVESAPASNFAAPTTRITFPQYTTSVGASWGTAVAGPITDTWFRLKWTITGTTPQYTVFGVIGIL